MGASLVSNLESTAHYACCCSQWEAPTSSTDADVVVATHYRWHDSERVSALAASSARPNLYDLKADFDACAGSDSKLGVSELAAAWKRTVERKTGKLRPADATLIEISS